MSLFIKPLIRYAVLILCLSWSLSAFAQSVSRGPYLQQRTDSSVIIKWRTDSSTDSVVRYGLDEFSLTQTTTVSGSRTEHEVAIAGLSTDTRYYYSVGNITGPLAGDNTYNFMSAPTVGANSATRLWIVGDSGTANADARAVRDAYKNAFSGNDRADMMIMLGDNAYNDGTDSQYQAAVFDIYPEILRQTPVWSTLGNHDGHSADSATQTGPYYDIFAFPALGQNGGLASGTEAYYSYDYANIHFVVLDSYETDRSVNGAMLTWLANDLAATSQEWLIAVWHHPPYTKGSHNSDTEGNLIDMRTNALPLLESYGVDLVLSGHSHSYERSFLLDGHYGSSGTFSGANQIDAGDGRPSGNGAYTKPDTIASPNQGAVYAVAGSSGKATGGSLDHPAMYISLNQLGSMVVDIDDNQMNTQFLNDSGQVTDWFTINKGTIVDVTPPTLLSASVVDANTVDVVFDEDLESTSATNIANYSIDQGVSISGAVLSVDGRTVTLSTSTLVAGPIYTVTASNMTDLAGNTIVANSNAQFNFTITVTRDYQNGVLPSVSYFGTDDSYMRSSLAGTNYGSSLEMLLDGEDAGADLVSVIGWDISDIPAGSTVTQASISLGVFNPSNSSYQVYQLLRDWDEGLVTWNTAGASSWQSGGAQGATDKGSAVLGTINASSTGTYTLNLNTAGVQLVQDWVDGTASNYGVVISNLSSADGIDMHSSEASTPTNRPKLSVTYDNPLPPTNTAPSVAAGADQSVTLPALASLNATVTDDGLPNPAAVTFAWSVVSGPGTVTFGSPNAEDTTASFSVDGTYLLRLTADDGDLNSSDDVQVTVNPTPPVNTAPSVAAGADQSITLPALASLDATVTDDGLPSPAAVTFTWSMVSGPGTVTFGSPNAEDTTASFSVDGTYLLRLTADDGDLNSSDDVQVTVNPAPPINTAPSVVAGADQSITLPALASLNATVTDDGLPTPAALTFTWSVVSGPGTVTFGSPNAEDTSASFSVNGTYLLRLTADDGDLNSSDNVQVTVNPAPPVNTAPNVAAGADQSITLPALASLNATVTDDGLPNPPSTVTFTWSVVSGPGTVTFGSPNAEDTTASFSVDGTYLLRLTADDGDLNSSDNVQVTVNPAPPINTAPSVVAGADQSITLPALASLDATVTDDGLPTPAALTFTWSMVSGPGTVTFGSPNAEDTSASFSVNGTYLLRLTADDGDLNSSDNVQVTVNPAPPVNTAPNVAAGADQSITLPALASLDATVTDDGLPSPAAVTFAWSMVSGPGTVTFGSPNAEDTTASFSVDGTYLLRLTADDGELNSSDDVQVTVDSVPAVSVVFVSSELTTLGQGLIQSGSYLNTQVAAGSEVLIEQHQGGKKRDRISALDHTWTIASVTPGALITLDVIASAPSNNENDNFVFAYSINGGAYTDFGTVTNGNGNQSLSVDLPSGTTGSVNIRVRDTNRTPGQGNADTVSVSYIASTSSGASGDVPPVVLITQPSDTQSFLVGDTVNFIATANDDNDGDVSGSIEWSSSLQGPIGLGASSSVSTLVVGSHVITATAQDSVPTSGSDSITITIAPLAGDNPPMVSITSPANGFSAVLGTAVGFSGTANDVEDGNISGAISWDSSLDGNIGSGANISNSTLSVGTHMITASATDSGSNTASDTISITITSAPGSITLEVAANKTKGKHTPLLSWSGADGTNVDIYRDGSQITTTANDGDYTDVTGNKGGRTYVYQVCETVSGTCSAEVTVVY